MDSFGAALDGELDRGRRRIKNCVVKSLNTAGERNAVDQNGCVNMNEATLIEKLAAFGLTRQEASIYLCLAANKELSGYEVSKLTGFSRSNVYNALASLVEKGAAYLLEGPTNKYTAVAAEEFCHNKIQHLQQLGEEIVREIPKADEVCEGYITIAGHKHIIDRIHTILSNVKYRVYLSLPMKYLEIFREDLQCLLAADKKVVLLVAEEVAFPGAIIYIREKDEDQIRLIADSAYVLTGDMTGSAADTSLYCGQPNFVKVFKDSMKNEIRLIELGKNETTS